MTNPVSSLRAGSPPPQPATQLSVPIGPAVIEVLDLAYRARRPVLLEGPTGIGKSQIVTEFARKRGLGVVVLDLSLLEPPDLVGLPVIKDGRTYYASPAELPSQGCGVIMLEELNRAEIPVMQPALQLLSARRLHAYELPEGWTCVAAVNPEDQDYQVNHLDPALRSRFLQLSVCADRDTWLGWATCANIHPIIERMVRDHADIFDHASPRSWTYASDLLHALGPQERADTNLLRAALRGYLPTSWSILVTEALAKYPVVPELDFDVILGPAGDAALAKMIGDLEARKRSDAVMMMASELRRQFAGPALKARAESGAVTLISLEKLLAPLPGDLREQCLESAVNSAAAPILLRQIGYDPAGLAESYGGSPLRSEVQSWRRGTNLHRVRLVVAAMMRWLDETRGDPVLKSGTAQQLALLAADAGPFGQDLGRWLRVRGMAPDVGTP
jgi:MoxR-like ATPase